MSLYINTKIDLSSLPVTDILDISSFYYYIQCSNQFCYMSLYVRAFKNFSINGIAWQEDMCFFKFTDSSICPLKLFYQQTHPQTERAFLISISSPGFIFYSILNIANLMSEMVLLFCSASFYTFVGQLVFTLRIASLFYCCLFPNVIILGACMVNNLRVFIFILGTILLLVLCISNIFSPCMASLFIHGGFCDTKVFHFN